MLAPALGTAHPLDELLEAEAQTAAPERLAADVETQTAAPKHFDAEAQTPGKAGSVWEAVQSIPGYHPENVQDRVMLSRAAMHEHQILLQCAQCKARKARSLAKAAGTRCGL